MKFRIPLFLWLSSLMAGLSFLYLGFYGSSFFETIGHAAGHELQSTDQEQSLLFEAWRKGFKVLGLLITIGGFMLFLFRKKLSNLAYTGIFAILMLISLVAASAAATYF